MRNVVGLVLISVLFAACESDPAGTEALAANTKKAGCKSCGLVLATSGYTVYLIDPNQAPPDTTSSFTMEAMGCMSCNIVRNGDHAYLSHPGYAPWAVDMTNPRQITAETFGGENQYDDAFGLFQVAGSVMYLRYLRPTEEGVYVFDLKDPAHPVEVAQIKLRDLPNSP
jgi:hypothetical protein